MSNILLFSGRAMSTLILLGSSMVPYAGTTQSSRNWEMDELALLPEGDASPGEGRGERKREDIVGGSEISSLL
jgi:hypothetical protein